MLRLHVEANLKIESVRYQYKKREKKEAQEGVREYPCSVAVIFQQATNTPRMEAAPPNDVD